MKHLHIQPKEGFSVLTSTPRSQAAIMVLDPGEATGGPDNKHDNSDQWLYVLSGIGRATVTGKQVDIGPGSLLLIEAGETHEIVNTSDSESLETINVYAPPEY
jgi:mannose-6-phosphate isomerase-like protein (cupin superfamily)